MQLLWCALLASGKDRKQLIILTLWLRLRLSKGFKTCFKLLRHFSCATVVKMLYVWLRRHDLCCRHDVNKWHAYNSCKQKSYRLNLPLDYEKSLFLFSLRDSRAKRKRERARSAWRTPHFHGAGDVYAHSSVIYARLSRKLENKIENYKKKQYWFSLVKEWFIPWKVAANLKPEVYQLIFHI